MNLRLFDFGPLADCYAVRLMAALLEVPLTIKSIDYYPGREHEEEPFLSLNPLGSLPVLDTGQRRFTDWQAILVFLAAEYDPTCRWHPIADPERTAALHEWLAIARKLGQHTEAARLHYNFGMSAAIDQSRSEAQRWLRHIDRSLWFSERDGERWLLPSDHPTIADVALFAHVILCEEGGIERMDYPAVRRWTDRVRRLPKFAATSGVFPLAELAS